MADRQRGNDIGPIGRRLGDQVRRVRDELEITQAELSQRLGSLGRAIPTASIGRMESGQRKIDIDDLMAIAYALDVSPLALLLPFTEAPSDTVRPAGVGREMDSIAAWEWALGVAPHSYESGNRDSQMAQWSQFRSRSRPWWLSVDASLNERLIAELRRLPAFSSELAEQPDPLYEGQSDTNPEWYRKATDGQHQAET